MRAGPATEDLAAGLAVGVDVRVIRAGRVLATNVPAADVVLEWSSGRTVPAQLTYTAPASWVPQVPLDPLGRFGQRSLVDVIYRAPSGQEWRVPLGQYVHTGWEADGDKVSVTCADLTRLLEDDPMAWPSSPPRGATLRSELQRLAGTLPVALDVGVTDSAVATTTQWGTSRTEAVQSLATSRSIGLRVEADGVLHAYPLRDASVVDVIYRQGGLLISAPPAPAGEVRRPNRWVVTGSTTEGGKETRWTATRTSTAAPYDAAGYGWVTRHEEASDADSQAAVNRAADTIMREDLYASRARSLTIVPDARLEVGDIVGVITASGETFAGRVTGYSLPVTDLTATMRVDVEVLDW
ncbi:hypothetical protein [Actinomyces procaprae]|uniref:hypothetical protein n=1 Tax=Actinomyces procaprae TaxID=2560010 RepID=UPI0010A2471D|nr:hypothetical protein [Actinomyces procaprae]